MSNEHHKWISSNIFKFYYFLIGKNSILLIKKEKLVLTMMNTNGPSKKSTNKQRF